MEKQKRANRASSQQCKKRIPQLDRTPLLGTSLHEQAAVASRKSAGETCEYSADFVVVEGVCLSLCNSGYFAAKKFF